MNERQKDLTISGFKVTPLSSTDIKPRGLSFFKNIKGFDVYYFMNNKHLYVIHNHIENLYVSYDRLKSNLNERGVDEHFETHLENLIEVIYVPKLKDVKIKQIGTYLE